MTTAELIRKHEIDLAKHKRLGSEPYVIRGIEKKIAKLKGEQL